MSMMASKDRRHHDYPPSLPTFSNNVPSFFNNVPIFFKNMATFLKNLPTFFKNLTAFLGKHGLFYPRAGHIPKKVANMLGGIANLFRKPVWMTFHQRGFIHPTCLMWRLESAVETCWGRGRRARLLCHPLHAMLARPGTRRATSSSCKEGTPWGSPRTAPQSPCLKWKSPTRRC